MFQYVRLLSKRVSISNASGFLNGFEISKQGTVSYSTSKNASDPSRTIFGYTDGIQTESITIFDDIDFEAAYHIHNHLHWQPVC